MIANSHELVDTPLYKVFPVLKPFARAMGKVKDETETSEHLLHDQEANKKKKKAAPPTDEKEPDPLNYLGFGMVAYRDLMFTMFMLFALMSVIMLPAMMFYKGRGGLPDAKGFAARYSLGNFGYSSSQCRSVPFTLGAIRVECPFGFVG
jgi:hypothetical protein